MGNYGRAIDLQKIAYGDRNLTLLAGTANGRTASGRRKKKKKKIKGNEKH
jgi:hypothetical protein